MTITADQIKRLRELMTKRDAANAAWSTAPYDPNARLHHDKCVGVLANEAIKYLPALLDALESRATPAIELDAYDAGLLSDFGGGNVGWWQDYIRAELGRAHEFYQHQMESRGAPDHIPDAGNMVPKPAPVPVDEAARYLIAAIDDILMGRSMGGIIAGRNRLLAALGHGAKAGEVGP